MTSSHPSRRTVVCAAAVLLLPACSGAAGGEPSPGPGATMRAQPNPFDALYDRGFALTPLSADPIPEAARPPRPSGLDTGITDPAYGTRLYRATDAADGMGGRMRHDYSRRQAFNADNSRYLAQDGAGRWYLYDARTFAKLRVLPELVGDCEPIWHPRHPSELYFTARNGGLLWWLYDVEDGSTRVAADFTGATPWPRATSLWTKGEGGTSADGRYLALMATSYDDAAQRNTVHGLVLADLRDGRIVGTLDASAFPVPGAVPDHIGTSPSGRHAVVSWLGSQGGTHAYSPDFTASRQLTAGSEHSDLAIGPNGEDYLVYADYGAGQIVAINADNGERVDLHPLYPAPGEAYALHISGQAFDRPGWVVVSTYADSADHGSTRPAPSPRPEYRKVWLLELKPSGRKLNVAHVRGNDHGLSGDAYFLEPQASASRDLSRIIFATNFGGGDIESYIVGLPSWVLD
ncbi:MAG: hypothetical protein Q3997_05620 [Propionibacteriaceae bacterium]|nr:hypothetical protein [Propionibacteriaceae bacterium]